MIDYSDFRKKQRNKALMANYNKRKKGKLIDSDRLDRAKDNIRCGIILIGFAIWMAWVITGVDS